MRASFAALKESSGKEAAKDAADAADEVCTAISKAIQTASIVAQSYQKGDKGTRNAQVRANNRKGGRQG